MRTLTLSIAILVCVSIGAVSLFAQGNEFTYQGSLKVGGNPANGNYDLQFELYAVLSGGDPIGTRTRLNIPVTNGVFTVTLDFLPGAFDGMNRFLEIAVKPAGAPGEYQQLFPRQPITHSPYSYRSLNADVAINATQLGGVAADQYVTTAAGNLNYIRNSTGPQATANFNLGAGVGGASIFDAAIQYNLAGQRVLSATSTTTFVGFGAGLSNTAVSNSFFGSNAGKVNSTGRFNSFFGSNAGFNNNTGEGNSFFGTAAGPFNTTGNNNSFFGYLSGNQNSGGVGNSFYGVTSGQRNTNGSFNTFVGLAAGSNNTDGFSNAFFGSNVGVLNSTGSFNSFFGDSAGFANTTASGNSFFGYQAGNATTGNLNSFFGTHAGKANSTGYANSFFGYNAGAANTTAINNSFFGQAAGFKNTEGYDNTFIGNGAGLNNLTGCCNAFVGNLAGQANTTGSLNSFMGNLAGYANFQGSGNSFFGNQAGQANTFGSTNVFVGGLSGVRNTLGNRNAFIGYGAGSFNTSGSSNTAVGYEAGAANGVGNNNTFIGTSAGGIGVTNNASGDNNTFIGRDSGLSNITGNSNTLVGASTDVGGSGLSNATAIGAGAVVSANNTIQLGRVNGSDTVLVPGRLQVDVLGAGGLTLCRNSNNRLSDCVSSLRYKTNVGTFTSGLDLVRRLRPITFNWKDGGTADVGFAAEEVAAIEPLLATYSKTGQIQGVKYAQITTVLVNAIKEQQKQIDELKKLVCGAHRKARACRK